MSIVQIIVIVFGVFALSRAFLRWRESKIKLGELFFWGFVWIGAILFAIFPDTLNLLSDLAGFRRGMDLVIALSIIVMFYLVFRLYVKLDEHTTDITQLVREITINKGKKKK